MHNADKNRTVRGFARVACVTALGLSLTAVAPVLAQTSQLFPPIVPAEIKVDPGFRLFFIGHGDGSQNYVCLPAANGGFAFALFTPEATLFNDFDQQVTTHFFSLNPDETGNPIRATWEHSQDSSRVWATAVGTSTDPKFVAQGAVAWLKLQVVGAEPGPTGGAKLVRTKFIQRINTAGGVAPSKGCAAATDVGNKAFVPYTADYLFYERSIFIDHTTY
jgi:hypothetical protein